MTSTLVAFATAIYGFGLPLSTAAAAIGTALLAIAFVLRLADAAAVRPWREPVMAIGLALLAFIALRTLLADSSGAAWNRINQYHELLLAPMLLVLWQGARERRIFFAAFIAGCLVLALQVWLSHRSAGAYAEMQKHRISVSFALAVASAPVSRTAFMRC